jgi:dolichol-phosphate mannosyltransferase
MIRPLSLNSGVELSAVVPVFNEEGSLGELHRRVTAVLDSLELPYELILVDDGSSDRTPEIISELCADDSRVRAVHFSRNFGHQAALAAGLQHASGRGVVVLDADLQDPPELIPELVARWRDGYQVVYAQRRKREREGVVKRGAAFLFYRTLKRITRFEIPADTGDFCLMDRAVVDLLNAMPERNRYVRGLRAWVGFRQTAVPFDRPPRYAGEPKYTFAGSFGLAVNGILALSKFPLRVATYFGLLVSFASFLLGAWYIVQRMLGNSGLVRGWASIVVIVLFLGGVQLLTIGIIGEYLSRIYDEVKQRPLFVVRERLGFEVPSDYQWHDEARNPPRLTVTE